MILNKDIYTLITNYVLDINKIYIKVGFVLKFSDHIRNIISEFDF